MSLFVAGKGCRIERGFRGRCKRETGIIPKTIRMIICRKREGIFNVSEHELICVRCLTLRIQWAR